MTALVVAPFGLGPTLAATFDSSAMIINGAHRGEAAVDLILTSSPDAIHRLRTSALPIIGVMALVARSATVSCEALRDAILQSTHWADALKLWRSWSSAISEPVIFRATALREDGLSKPRGAGGCLGEGEGGGSGGRAGR